MNIPQSFSFITFILLTTTTYLRIFEFVDSKILHHYEKESGFNKGNEDSVKVVSTITVDNYGHGTFTSIQAAIDSIPSGNKQWTKVQISSGTYKEKVTIPRDKQFIVVEGKGRDQTIVTANGHEATDTTATFSFFADNLLVRGITFENSFDISAGTNLSRGRFEVIKQALAAEVFGDKSAFYECGFIGVQDTLWDAQGRHYFKDCYIQGAIDFIWGSGQSIYENTEINVTVGLISKEINIGFITAQGRSSASESNGFIFQGGSIFGSGQALLGRAYGSYSRVIFSQTKFDNVIAPSGWDAWNSVGHERRNTFYAEVNCEGPGSDTSKRVPWEKKIGVQQMNQFSLSSFVDQDMWTHQLPQ